MRRKGIAIVVGIMTLSVFFCMGPAAYATGKIAYVDLSQSFDKYEKTKVFDEQLSTLQKDKEKELEQLSNDIKTLEDKMSLLSEKEKTAKQQELDVKSKKLKETSQQVALDLRKERDEKLKEILQDIEKVVQSYAQKNGYDFILNDRVLLYGAASADVTQDIVELLNSGFKGKGPEGKDEKKK